MAPILPYAAALIVFVMAGPAPARSGTPLTYESFVKWVEDQHRLAQGYPPIDGLMIEYEVEFHHRVSDAQIRALVAEVRGKPDHPKRHELQALLQARERGPTTRRNRFWSGGPGVWRRCEDGSNSELPMLDQAMNRQSTWLFGGKQVRIGVPDQPEVGQMYSSQTEFSVLIDIRRMLFQPFPATCSPAVALEDFRPGQGGEFTAVVGAPADPARLRLAGRWIPEDARAELSSVTRIAKDQSDRLHIAVMIDGHMFDPAIGLWVAKEVLEVDPARGSERTLRFIRAEPFDPSMIDELTAPPSRDRPDPIRGVQNIESVWDYSGGTVMITEGDAPPRPMLGAMPREKVPTGASRWQWIGWSSAGAIGAALVILRLRRSAG
ncbi:MAG TPA: hypothetical protein DEB06_02850 [Phycisphaerales bacterium]|nr:hypothetical protein [Phycisphaerales bacterium]